MCSSDLKFQDGAFVTGVAKFVEPIKDELIEALGLEDGDLVLFGVGSFRVACTSLGQVRLQVGEDLDLIPEDAFKGLWVVDFPMFDWDEDRKRWVSEHHPFTAPLEKDLDLLDSDPGKCISSGYDLVINGSRSEEHTSERQSQAYLACRLPLEKKKRNLATVQD